MKRLSTLLFAIVAFCTITSQNVQAQGWPANYGGVMLQGFYWDSYSDSKLTKLTSQADELSQYFNLIWIPNTGKTSDYYYSKRNTMGYDPCFWLDQNSCWGTEDELRTMISTFKAKGTGIIEDVVINHKNGKGDWVTFPNETYTGKTTGKTYSLTWDNTNYTGICSTDEANKNTASGVAGKIKGNPDTGDDFSGYRDLDHTNATVQANVKTYLDFLLNEIGYAGFRYDMVKGYGAAYTKIYNESAKPTYSVGECWDSKTTITTWINNNGKTSAAFDFPMKYNINDAFGSNTWSKLASGAVAQDDNYKQYAVTFVDNHDTYRSSKDGGSPLNANIEAANAYLLTMPGTPCVFLRHWQMYKTAIKKLIFTRKQVGITNTSTIETQTAQTNGFVLKVKGTKGEALLLLGTTSGVSTTGFKLATSGDNYQLYVSTAVDITGIDDIKDEVKTFTIPSFCTWTEGETFAFFEKPSNWGSTVKCWMWDNSYNYTTNKWPGSTCTKVGTADNGNEVWKWTAKASEKVAQSSTNKGIIFNDGTNQTNDMTFVNGGYYDYDTGLVANLLEVAAGIDAPSTISRQPSTAWYTLSGQRIDKPSQKGIYIHNGRKVIVK